MSQRWSVMYTHQKTKKAKTWSDGTLVFNTATGRAELLDEDGESIDTGFVQRGKLLPDAIIELDGHLIEVQGGGSVSSAPAGPTAPLPVVKPARSVSFEALPEPDAKKPKTAAAFTHAPAMVRPPAQRAMAMPLAGVASQPAAKRSVLDVLKMLAAAAPPAPSHHSDDVVDDDDDAADMAAAAAAEAAYSTPRVQQQPFRALSMGAEAGTGTRGVAGRHTAAAPTRPSAAALPFTCGPLRWPLRHQVSTQRFLQVPIPPRFESLREYCEVYTRAVRECVHLPLARCAELVYASKDAHRNVELHPQSQLTHREWRGAKGKLMMSLRLQLAAKWQTRSRGEHQKDDLWALSLSGTFEDAFLVRAVFGGVSNDGGLAVEMMPDNNWPHKTLPKGTVTACRVVAAGTELQELTALAAFGESDPLCNALVMPMQKVTRLERRLAPFPPALSLSGQAIAELEEATAQRFTLNADQRSALARVSRWFSGDDVSDVFLIHGVFGSGKSALLVAMILFMVQLMDASETADNGGVERGAKLRVNKPPFRIAISSATNTAVDRVLEGLLVCGFTEFLRVGSLRKMSRKVLPYTLYEEEKDAMHELKRQLNSDELSTQERLDLERELEELRSGRAGKRKLRLHLTPVVGTTCSASVFKLFNDHEFQVLLLDEASQMVEPLSLLPVQAFKPRKLIVVGDPMQLAPPLPTERPGARDLSLALFSRLAPHYPPLVLRTQYRCHPRIAGLASDLFYGGALQSGVSAEQRQPLLNGLDTLMFLDSAGMGAMVRDASGSYSNAMHTRITTLLLLRVAAEWPSADAMATRVGVIALFRAQVAELRGAFNKHVVLQNVRVSTVDAFQGAENDVIVVVTSQGTSNQFVGDVRRLNVTLTRARHHLFVVGQKSSLRVVSPEWAAVIDACTYRDAASLLMDE